VFSERTSVGLDVHARSVVAAVIDTSTGEVFQSRLTPSHEHVLAWVRGLPGPVAVAYEAGPTGAGLHRAATSAGIRCEVVAPSKLQCPAGDRVRTDARDAIHLARLLRMDEFTAVAVPSLEQEAARDLVRAREDARGDPMRARYRLSELLLRRGVVYCGGQAWTEAHDRWFRQLRFDQRAVQPGIGVRLRGDAAGQGPEGPARRRDRGHGRGQRVHRGHLPSCCLRGVGTLTGFALAVEVGDRHRFTGATIGSFVGLVPPEVSSGASRVQGPITKASNTHVRRLLVEAAWHHRTRYAIGKTMLDRWDLAGPAARARSG